MPFSSLYVVLDNRAREGFRSCWGLSLLLEGDTNLLFDAGPSGDDLLHNLALFGKNPAHIDIFFLSHSHADHSGGLRGLQDAGFTGEIILCDSMPQAGTPLAGTGGKELQPLDGDLAAIRLSAGGLKEQSLLAETSSGTLLLVGCAHPGLERIWDVACRKGAPFGVVGGFHDSPPFSSLGEARLLGPCHCTQMRDAFRAEFPSSFKDVAAGDHIRFGSDAS